MKRDSGTWSVSRVGRVAIRVVFEGHLSVEGGAASAARCVELFGRDSLHLIADAPRFESYDPAARAIWQSTLWPLRGQITGVTLHNKKPLVRMGVTAFGLFLGAPVTVVDSDAALQDIMRRLSSASPQPGSSAGS